MAVMDQLITDNYAIYNADCIETMKQRFRPSHSIYLVIRSSVWRFVQLQFSRSERDLSNCADYDEFFVHYAIRDRRNCAPDFTWPHDGGAIVWMCRAAIVALII